MENIVDFVLPRVKWSGKLKHFSGSSLQPKGAVFLYSAALSVLTTRWQALIIAHQPSPYDEQTIVQNRKPLNKPPIYLFLQHHLINKTKSFGMLKVYLCSSNSY